MKLSVIIPCYNSAATLGDQLEALVRQQWSESWEIVIADNGSTDHSRQVAESFKDRLPNLRVVDASERKGAAHARNTAIKAAFGEGLALCDADDEVGDGWLAAMGAALERHDFVACRMETAKLNPRWMRGHEQEKGLQTIWYPPWLPHAGSGTMGFKRKVFDAVGGFDENMHALEDTEFSFQVQKKGFDLHYVPEAVLHVRRRGTLMDHYRQSRNYAEFNVILAKRYWTPEASALRYWVGFMRDWWGLLRRLPGLRTTSGRFSWMWGFGRQIGRMKGVVKCGGVPV
jgi:glycosyltransferase involved in cell wall biosynthesis